MRLALTLVTSMLTVLPAVADQATPGTLAGHALVPALTFFDPPADAPADLAVSGKFTGADRKRVDALGATMGASYISAPGVPRETGVKLPFKGQPMQGFSGIKSAGDGAYWVLQDNGLRHQGEFGRRHAGAAPDPAGLDERQGRRAAHLPARSRPQDPVPDHARRHRQALSHRRRPRRRKLPADRRPDLDRRRVRSLPDPHRPERQGDRRSSRPRSTASRRARPTITRSRRRRCRARGAVRRCGARAATRRWRRRRTAGSSIRCSKARSGTKRRRPGRPTDGREYLRILEFDVARQKWTGRLWKYRLEVNGNNIGDFNMIDATTGLIIERDNGEGELPAGLHRTRREPDCFNVPAKMQAHLQDRADRRQRRRLRAQDRPPRPAGDQGPDRQGQARARRKASSPSRSSPSRTSMSSTTATSSSPTTTTCRTRRAASSASRTTTN